MSIKRKDLPWYWFIYAWNPTSVSLFEKKDIDMHGNLRKIFRKSVIEVFEEDLQLKYKEDYKIKKVKCKFKETQTYNTTELSFSMSVGEDPQNPFPDTLTDEEDEETNALSVKLKKKILDGIRDGYNMEVEISFDEWGFGSIKIGGSVVLLHGQFTEDIKKEVLELMKRQAKQFFNSPQVIPKELPIYEKDRSALELTVLTSLIKPKSVAAVDEKKDLINQWFMRTVRTELTKGSYSFILEFL